MFDASTTPLFAAVNLQRSDMLEFKTATQFDAIIYMGNSIGYGAPATTRKLLQAFSSALRTGGHFILDTRVCAESLLPIAPERRLEFPVAATTHRRRKAPI